MTKRSCEEIWEKCLTVIQDNVSYQNFKMWFKPIVPVAVKGNILTIQVPSQFFYEWLEQHYITLIKKTIKKELGKEGKLEYHIIIENSTGSKPYITKIPSSNSNSHLKPNNFGFILCWEKHRMLKNKIGKIITFFILKDLYFSIS